MLKGKIKLNGDKSISHRILCFAGLAKGKSIIKNLSLCNDVQTTINILQQCNINITRTIKGHIVYGGLFKSNDSKFYCANSGTTARFMLGLLPSQGISGTLHGDKSLSRRPMGRVIKPLSKMQINFKGQTNTLPISFMASSPLAHNHILEVPSAQVKSALILCSLACKKASLIKDPFNTRNHTENFLSYLGLDCNIYKKFIFKGFKYTVPGDASNAAFIISAAILIRGSNIILHDVLYNKTRRGYINVLKKMGAKINISNIRTRYNEGICDIQAQYSNKLYGVTIEPSQIISMIDELPIFALVASQASGESVVTGAEELKYKESNRISSIVDSMRNLKVNIAELSDGYKIKGPNKLYNTSLLDYNDHRIVLTLEIAKLLMEEPLTYNKIIDTSFPAFYNIIKKTNA